MSKPIHLKARVKCTVAMLKRIYPYLLHPSKIEDLVVDRNFLRDVVVKSLRDEIEDLTDERDAVVKSLRNEIKEWRAAADEAEQEYIADYEELCRAYEANIAALKAEISAGEAEIAALIAENAMLRMK